MVEIHRLRIEPVRPRSVKRCEPYRFVLCLPFEEETMGLMSRTIAASAGICLLSLAACSVNTAPPTVAAPAQPTPVVVQPPPPSGSAVVVQPRPY